MASRSKGMTRKRSFVDVTKSPDVVMMAGVVGEGTEFNGQWHSRCTDERQLSIISVTLLLSCTHTALFLGDEQVVDC